MTIRTRLAVWFTIAALLPAVILVAFSVGEAGRRFRIRAEEELQRAEERGGEELQQFRRELSSALRRALESSKVEDLIDTATGTGERYPNLYLAAGELGNELALGLDFLDFLRDDGTVLSSLQWKEFAGHRDPYWEQLAGVEDGAFVLGPVRVFERDRLAMRVLYRRRGITIVGGRAVDATLLSRFSAGARGLIYLVDRVSGRVLSSGGTDVERRLAAELKRRLIEDLEQIESGRRWHLSAGDFYVGAVELEAGGEGEPAGEIIFLYPSKELDEAVAGLLTTFILAAAVGVVIALIMGFFVARNVARPLGQLVHAFDMVSLGDFSPRLSRHKRDELGGLFDSFNGMAQDLETLRDQLIRSERVAAWQEVARKVAHEIKNPLSPIQLSIETLRKARERRHQEFESIFNESTLTILEEVEKIRRIVQEFSDFARMPEPVFEPTDLRQVAEKVVRLCRPHEKGIEVRWRVERVPNIDADRDQIARLLTNLVLNATEAMGDAGGEITISIGLHRGQPPRDRRYVRIAVDDNGPGMPEDVRRSVFTPYFTTKPDGTGLGLVIAQRIAEQHGGRIAIDSVPDRGTVVEVMLPLTRN